MGELLTRLLRFGVGLLIAPFRAYVRLSKRVPLHWLILSAMLLGVVYGVVAAAAGAAEHVGPWTEIVGKKVFLNLLKMIAVPLVLFSLVAGVASLNDTSKVARIGGKTVLVYISTTAVAITIGLVLVNLFAPGGGMSPEIRDRLAADFREQQEAGSAAAQDLDMIDQLVAIVPSNPFESLARAYDGRMLQVVFFSLLLGLALTRLKNRRNAEHITTVFQTLSDAIIEMVHLIMTIAPFGVFALIANVVADLGARPDQLADLLTALLSYMGVVLLGLLTHGVLVYGFLVWRVARVSPRRFLRAMVPAQLLAFSSSSSGATLPVTLDCVEKGIGVDEQVSSFVLPLGATINMDGTGLYQGVAAVFIANVYGLDLDLGAQLVIVLTATMASIGTAAVPGVGIVMLTIVLTNINVPVEGIALILGVDRPLDMCRTVLNVTGDATVATVVAASEDAIHPEQRAPVPGE